MSCDPFKRENYLHRGELGSSHFLGQQALPAQFECEWEMERSEQERETIIDGALGEVTMIIQSSSLSFSDGRDFSRSHRGKWQD